MTTSADLASITAADIMRTSVVTVDASAPIAEAERLLSEHRIGGAPVTDEAGHICGVVSIRDILERYADAPEARAGWRQGFYDVGDDGEIDERPGIDIPEDSGDTVRDVMTAQVHTVEPGAALPAIAARMTELGVHRILVTDGAAHVGLISTFDVLRAIARPS